MDPAVIFSSNLYFLSLLVHLLHHATGLGDLQDIGVLDWKGDKIYNMHLIST